MPRTRHHQHQYQYDAIQPRQRRFTCLKIFLLVVGVLAAIVVLGALVAILYGAVAPYGPLVGKVLLGVLAFFVLAAMTWVVISLYGTWQEQLQKRDNRDVVRIQKDERLAVRNHQTRKFDMLWEGEPTTRTPVIEASRTALPFQDVEQLPFPVASPGRLPLHSPDSFSQVPNVIYYANISGSVRPGYILMGIRPNGTLRTGTWDDEKTLLVLGGMASGKTNTIAEKTVEAASGGALLAVCDPHAHKPDSLYRRVAPLAHVLFPGTVLAVTHEDILANMTIVRQELERRVGGSRYSRPLVFVIDEWNRLQRDEDIARELMLIVEQMGQEGRGFGVYGIIGAQRITYTGELRKSVVSFIVHRVDESEARLVLPQRFARFAPELPNGMTFVKDADGMTERLQQVLITSRDIQEIAYRLPGIPRYQGIAAPSPKRTVDLRQHPQTIPNVSKQDEQPLEQRLARSGTLGNTVDETPKDGAPNTLNVSSELRKEIIHLARSGMSRRKIKDKLGLHGARYELIRRVLDEAGL